jgi:mevalonate kinase
MPVVFGKAPGKVILFGEHAVVYGQPAIAIPITKVSATVRISPNLTSAPGKIRIQAPDIQLDSNLSNLPEDHPLAKAVRLTLETITPTHTPALTIQVSSTIPISAGMGSGAAISVALIRTLSAFLGDPLPSSKVSDLTYQVEIIHHSTPSGIDNNVVTYQKPVYFVRDKPIRFLKIDHPTWWIIADTGEKTPTRVTVSDVGAQYANDPKHYGKIFKNIGTVTQKAREALTKGELSTLGKLMNENQQLLEQLNVSSPSLDTLISAARSSGAEGAKLSGGGRGGNMIALVAPNYVHTVEKALREAGADQVITTLLAKGK